MILRWKRIYKTGISDTDQRNKKLVCIINEFYKYISDECIIDHAERIITQLLKVSTAHFHAEKELFNQYNFTVERIEKHIEEHKLFIEVLKNALISIQSGDLPVCYKTADFLRSWIVKHMLGSDREFGLFVKNIQKVTV